jgi:hypothetical protein
MSTGVGILSWNSLFFRVIADLSGGAEPEGECETGPASPFQNTWAMVFSGVPFLSLSPPNRAHFS